MSYSPLEGSFSKSNKSKKIKLVTIFVSLAVIGIGGGVLAANITIATNSTVEFGQGVASAVACDTSITVVPTTSFNNSESRFYISEIALEGVDQRQGTSAGNNGCNGKTLTVKALDSSGTVLGSKATVIPSATETNANFTVIPTPSITATLVSKFVIESN